MIDDWQFDATRRAKAAQIDTAAPNAARVADFLNEGRNDFEADRRAARVMMASAPAIAEIVPAVLAFHQRAVHFLALEAGIRQFLDIGTGLSGVEISCGIAQSVDPACRIVYVDNDPMTLAHVRAFSTSTSQGAIAGARREAHRPGRAPRRGGGDTGPPAAGSRAAANHAPVHPEHRARGRHGVRAARGLASRELSRPLPRGERPRSSPRGRRRPLEQDVVAAGHRPSGAEVAAFTAGLELVPPGMLPVNEWRPAFGGARLGQPVPVYAVLAGNRRCGRVDHA